jgi:hypothetical protein
MAAFLHASYDAVHAPFGVVESDKYQVTSNP